MNEMDEIRHRLDLVDKQYLSIRENVAKMEKVQYMLREQIGFIEYMAMGPDYPSSLEERMQNILKVVEQLQHQLGASPSITVPHPIPTSQQVPIQDALTQPIQQIPIQLSPPVAPAPAVYQPEPVQQVAYQPEPVQQVAAAPQLDEVNPVLKIKETALNQAEESAHRNSQSSTTVPAPPSGSASVPRPKKKRPPENDF